MSYFEGQSPRWAQQQQQQQHGRQQSWDPSQAGNLSPAPRDDQSSGASFHAFGLQYDEIARATDNLAKSSKGFGGAHGRRDSMPMMGGYAQSPKDPRAGGQQRHHSISDYDGMRSPHPSNSPSSYQGYVSNQRFGPRPSEAEQMMQAKRRAAAQRERELRNYHQEQQYNRSVTGPKSASERSMSPSTAMSEDDRRELIARQHRALYGNDSSLYPEGGSPRSLSQDARVLQAPGSHGSTPLGYDAFSMPVGSSADGVVSMPAVAPPTGRSRENSTASSPAPGNFAMFTQQEQAQAQVSGSASPKRQESGAPSSGGVAPIGTRPAPGIAQGKRGTPPMPSPLGYGYSSENKGPQSVNERSQSAASNPAHGGSEKPSNLGWNGGQTAPWGPNKMQASVWG